MVPAGTSAQGCQGLGQGGTPIHVATLGGRLPLVLREPACAGGELLLPARWCHREGKVGRGGLSWRMLGWASLKLNESLVTRKFLS